MSFQGKGNRSHTLPTIYKDIYISKDVTKKEVIGDKKYAPKPTECASVFRAVDGAYLCGQNHHQGISGTICKHLIPGKFMFLCHGKEGYIYTCTILKDEMKKVFQLLLFKYDLSCKLGI
jgi:hypothetical protein